MDQCLSVVFLNERLNQGHTSITTSELNQNDRRQSDLELTCTLKQIKLRLET